MKKKCLYIGRLITFFIITAAVLQFLISQYDDFKYPPRGKLISVGNHKMHIYSTGKGGPSVILDSGLRCCSLDWTLVQPEIAKFTHVSSYDRSGTGWSDESPSDRTSTYIVEELHTLLQCANIPPPYILVGHSFGGMNARLYASRYPDEILGLVIVDSPHEDLLYQTPPQPHPTLTERIFNHPNVLLCGSYLGLPRLFHLTGSKRYVPSMFSNKLQKIYAAKTSTVKFARTTLCELFHLEKSIAQLKQAKKSFGNKPLTIITAGKCPESKDCGRPQEWIDAVYDTHLVLQKKMVFESSQGKQIFAQNSDHMIPLHQPEIIVEAVREMVEKSR